MINKIKKGATTHNIQDARINVSASDNGKVLSVVEGELVLRTIEEPSFGSSVLPIADFYSALADITLAYAQGKIKLMFVDGAKGRGYELQVSPTFDENMGITGSNFYYFDEEGEHNEMTNESVGYVIVYGYGIVGD